MRYIFGKWMEDSPLSVYDVRKICNEAEKRRRILAEYPTDRILSLFGRLRRLWLDPGYELRRSLEDALPGVTGFSPEMVKLAFDELGLIFDPSELQRKLRTELNGIPRTGDWKYCPESRSSLSWQPLGIMLHILSGNVFLVAAGSLVGGLITGNVNILKMSSQEQLFLPKLIESMRACDEEGIISHSIAAINFSGSDKEVIAEFKSLVDAIVVWGGEDAVRAYRNDLPAKTRIVVFGPRLSLAVVTKAGMEQSGGASIAAKLAREVAIWDQNACTAPQVCFVEGRENAVEMAENLSKELSRLSVTLPQGEIDFEAAVEIRKLRTVFELAHARGEGFLFESPRDLKWTVMVDTRESVIDPSPLYRSLRIIPYEDLSTVLSSIEELRGYVQTVGLEAETFEQVRTIREILCAGALRVVDIGGMEGGSIDDPHDGAYDMPQFVNIVFSTSGRDDYELIDLAPPEERKRVIDERLRLLIERARGSTFYGKRLEGITIETVDDLAKIPVLTRDEMEANSPPRGNGLATGPIRGGYVSRSGGSTGEPKYAIYDGHDWEEMIQGAVRLFRAMGMSPGDRVANCFIAGNLYGSFVSFDHINCRVGVTTFAFGSEVDPEIFLDTWRKFQINVVMGVPATIAPLLRAVKKKEPSFTLPKILYAGATLSAADYQWMKSELQAEIITSVIGANDGGQIAFQCASLQGTPLHHTIDDFNYIEIVDEDGKAVPEGSPGRILITSLSKHNFPLIRYEIGDEGRIVTGRCACDRSMRMLEYLGRCDDCIIIGLLNMHHRDFQAALRSFPLTEIQLVARSCEEGEYLVVKAESAQKSDGLASEIHEAILKGVAMIQCRIESGGLRRVEVDILDPGKIERNPRTGKIRRIVDERS